MELFHPPMMKLFLTPGQKIRPFRPAEAVAVDLLALILEAGRRIESER